MMQPPTMVGRYAIHGRIASGGMATVHIGRLAGSAGFTRTVAIKRLHAHLAQDQQFVLMFIDEARIAARIHHPNVVQTLDVVSAGDELLLVMDYVPGESLSRLMHASTAHGQAAPPRIAAAIMSGVLHGLHAAHEARDEKGEPLEIVHRDVSPQNVLIGIDGIPRLIDFGVATAVGRLQSTSSGTLKGKMAYMAPERVRGDSADRRSDIYATAVLLWEMLTGRRLFRGDDETQILAQVLKGWHEPPSAHSPGLSPLFDPVVMRGLALDPTERFTTAAEMARALEACSGLASPSEVGDWVQAMAGEELTRRAEAISRVESQSGTMPAATVETLSGADVQTSISDVRSSPSRISARLRVAALAASPAMRAALGVTIPTGPALFVGAAAIVAGIVLATVLALRGRPDAAAPSTVPSVSVSAVTTPEETGAAATPEPTEETPPSASSVVAPSRAAPRALVPGGPATPPLSRPRPNCDPPYVYDVDGVKHYKRECN